MISSPWIQMAYKGGLSMGLNDVIIPAEKGTY